MPAWLGLVQSRQEPGPKRRVGGLDAAAIGGDAHAAAPVVGLDHDPKLRRRGRLRDAPRGDLHAEEPDPAVAGDVVEPPQRGTVLVSQRLRDQHCVVGAEPGGVGH